MKKYWVASTLLGLMLLFSFQNCQRPPYKDELNNSLNQTVSTQDVLGNKLSLANESIDQLNLYSEAVKQVTDQGRTYGLIVQKVLAVNTHTGEILVKDNTSDQIQGRYCLTPDLKNELKNILASSSVCKDDTVKTGMCSQVLSKPYASIITAREQFDLGTATDSCGSNKIDLCDGQTELLKGFAAAVTRQLLQMPCN